MQRSQHGVRDTLSRQSRVTRKALEPAVHVDAAVQQPLHSCGLVAEHGFSKRVLVLIVEQRAIDARAAAARPHLAAKAKVSLSSRRSVQDGASCIQVFFAPKTAKKR
jgi:hypothetical protein